MGLFKELRMHLATLYVSCHWFVHLGFLCQLIVYLYIIYLNTHVFIHLSFYVFINIQLLKLMNTTNK
jgi:hypothetical protein